ncbi:hypothetical protein DPMN_036920 [Dreissena polymorpha]|uniref:Uncharacterized protein n=1 Tax=Dreissena polymorpha TaxID=45954 RepID=A0A9D4MBN0_DREPO|nr:hypothetical protein DPMN_036920 [Dreissena polymorpha]
MIIIDCPVDSDAWERVAEEFKTPWNVPHASRALEGNHVAIRKHPKTGTMTDYHCTTNKEELRTNVIELAEDVLGLTGNDVPTGTMGKVTRFELDKDGLATG